MKNLFFYLCFSLFFTLSCTSTIFSKPKLLNRIEGLVYDPNRVPVSNLRVELQDELGSLLTTTRTTSGGRFTFVGISAGHFIVKVVPAGLNYLEESKDVEVVQVTRFSSDTAYVEVYLRYDKRSDEIVPKKPAEAIFVQEIPKDAKKLYENGIDDLKKHPDKGLFELDEAVKLFPDYFDALSSLGKEYSSRKDYQRASSYLLRAANVNPRSISAYYSLSYAFFQLNQIPTALAAAKAVTVLAPDYVDAQLLYGILLRVSGNYKDAEIVLLKARSLANPPNPEIHWQLALLYNKLNRNKDAADELETYLKVYPNSPDKVKVQDLIIKLRNSKQPQQH